MGVILFFLLILFYFIFFIKTNRIYVEQNICYLIAKVTSIRPAFNFLKFTQPDKSLCIPVE